MIRRKSNIEQLIYAVKINDISSVRRLLQYVNPQLMDSAALRFAALNGNTKLVRLLLPLSVPTAWDSLALRWAAKNGHVEVVKLLIPVSDPKAKDSEAIRVAAENGHTDVVKLLIPVSDSQIVGKLKLEGLLDRSKQRHLNLEYVNSGRSNENVTMNKTLFSLLLEALKPSQYRKYVKGWDHTKQAELFGGKYRIYLPLEKYVDDSDDKQEESRIEPKLRKALLNAGFELVDYKKGIVTDKYKREVNVGRVLNKLQSKNPEIADLRKEFEQDPVRFGLKQKSTEKLVVISRHPYDIAGQSTRRGWTSCKNLETGSMKKHVCPETKYDLIAYLIEANDRNIENPIGRLMIHCYKSDDKSQTVFVAEEKIYPKELNIKLLGNAFKTTINKWLLANFKQTNHKTVYLAGDTYLDTLPDVVKTYEIAIGHNDVEFFKTWKPSNIDIANAALRLAAHNGNTEIVKLLIPVSDPKAEYSAALRLAAESGHIEVVKLLIPVSDPKAQDSHALRWAAHNGNVELVKLLIPLSDPKALDSYALRNAAYNGHVEVVKLLIPVSDQKARDSWALRNAVYNGHTEVVKMLIPVSDPKVVKELGLVK